MFDALKSKLFSPIMSGLVKFFSLGENATEADVHAAIEANQAPLDEQIAAARAAGAGDLEAVNSRLTGMEASIATLTGQVEQLTAENATASDRVAELQTEMAAASTAHEAAVVALKGQHTKEVNALAGQVAAFKSGKANEQDEGGAEHEANKRTVAPKGTIAFAGSALQDLLKPAKAN